MEWDIKDFCSICKGIFKSSETIGITEETVKHLKCLIPNWNCSLENAAICLTCLEKIQSASTFKTSYLHNSQNNVLIKAGSSTSSIICEICKRICNQEDCIPLCDSVSETGANLIRYLSVELETKLQDDSQTCEVCYKSLLNFYSITNLLELVNRDNVDELEKCDMIDIKDIERIDNVSVVNSVKTEIKEEAAPSTSYAIKEEIEDTSDNEVFHLKQEEVDFKMESEDNSEEDGNNLQKIQKERNRSALSNLDGPQSDCTEIKFVNEGSSKNCGAFNKNCNQSDMCKCKMCDFQNNFKSYLKKQSISVRIIDRNEMYRCEICEYKTNNMRYFPLHMMIHENSDKVELFKCQVCEYITINKYSLEKHMMVHEMFKCEVCEYKTKHKNYFKTHLMIHTNPDEIDMFKCTICKYETKVKRYLKRHMRIHKNSVEI